MRARTRAADFRKPRRACARARAVASPTQVDDRRRVCVYDKAMDRLEDMIARAGAARDNAYAPYSGFTVGACLRAASGRLFAGCNVENAAFPEGQCAETSALGAMIAAGERRIVEIVVVASGDGLCFPCGGCRQRLGEFAAPDCPVHVCGPEGVRRTTTLGALLPEGFAAGPALAEAPAAAWEGAPAAAAPEAAEVAAAVKAIRARAPGFAPRAGIIIGSGLESLADLLLDSRDADIDGRDVPGFPPASRLGLGRRGALPIAVFAGRAHYYEGDVGGAGAPAIRIPVRSLRALGAETLLITSAAGGLRPELTPGSLMLIRDHISVLPANPLVGPNDARIGPRFPDMQAAYDANLAERFEAAAAALGIALTRGVYLAVQGPSYETPAEIAAYARLGADAVGMSTVPEVLVARHCGLRVAAVSVITNPAAGLGGAPLNHEAVLTAAAAAAKTLGRLLAKVLDGIADGSEDG